MNVVSRSIFIALFNGSRKFCNFSRVLLLLKRLVHYTEFLRLVVVSFGLALHLHTPYFPAQTAATRLILLSVVASSMQQRVGFFSAKYKMHCLSAPRVLPKTSAADEECWGNVDCWNLKHGRVGFRLKQRSVKALQRKKQQSKLNYCFPLRDDEDCCGKIVSYPGRLFPMFDCYKNPNTGTFICEAHFRLADKDKRICDNEAYTLPKTVRHWHLLILPSPGMLLCTTKPFVGVSDNLPRPQTHPQTQLYLFDQRSRSQSTDSTSPNLTGMNS